MLITISQVDSQNQGSAHILHAVVLNKCLDDKYELVNSYPSDPVITIPKNRKTSHQHLIRDRCHEFGNVTEDDVMKIFAKHATIDWDSAGGWVLSDEAYALEFILKTNVAGIPSYDSSDDSSTENADIALQLIKDYLEAKRGICETPRELLDFIKGQVEKQLGSSQWTTDDFMLKLEAFIDPLC